MALDIEALLLPVSEEEPVGPDLSYDPDFRRISRELDEIAAKEKPGDDPTVGPALQTAIDLLGRSRDLWIASHGACFALYAGDLDALNDLVKAMSGIASTFWDNCYPALDEGSDPAGGRREACRQLATIGRTVRHFERLNLPPLKSKGRLSFKDLAGGADESATGVQMIEQMAEAMRRAVDDTPVEDWQAFSAQLETLLAGLNGLVGVFAERVFSGQEPDMTPFTAVIARVKSLSDAVVARKSPMSMEEVSVDAGMAGGGESAGPVIRGPISTRTQAIQQLEAVKTYFQQAEPSSPLPLLIDRVCRLANMGFMELMQNIAPNGVDDATRLLEPPQAEQSSDGY